MQDAVRAVLELAAEGKMDFESSEHARNYFLRAVHNRAVDSLRGAERGIVRPLETSEALAGPDPEPHESLIALEDEAARSLELVRVSRALEGLRPAEREAVQLRYVEGLSLREISERMGAAISTVHSRVEAGLAKIRARIGKEGQPT